MFYTRSSAPLAAAGAGPAAAPLGAPCCCCCCCASSATAFDGFVSGTALSGKMSSMRFEALVDLTLLAVLFPDEIGLIVPSLKSHSHRCVA